MVKDYRSLPWHRARGETFKYILQWDLICGSDIIPKGTEVSIRETQNFGFVSVTNSVQKELKLSRCIWRF